MCGFDGRIIQCQKDHTVNGMPVTVVNIGEWAGFFNINLSLSLFPFNLKIKISWHFTLNETIRF
jgi:hypothetical protein